MTEATRIPSAGSTGTRQDRRKARTRQSLIDAAVQLTVAGRAGQASIQEITDTADIGFGSFYNHFTSKDELFAIACSQVLERWGVMLDRACQQIEDPAEVFAASFRLCARLARTNPDLARFLTQIGLAALAHADGLAPRALRDITAAQVAGRFAAIDPELAVSAVAGGLIGLLARELEGPAFQDDRVAEELIIGLLRMLGLDADEAARVASRPLPDLDGQM